MGSNRKFRFTIRAGASERVVMSLSEHTNGDVTLAIRPGHYQRDLGRLRDDTSDVSDTHRARTESHYYSVHVSPSSPDTNLIKHTLQVEGHESINHYHYTWALKAGGRLCHIFSRRSSNLQSKEYIQLKNNGQSKSLGAFDPGMFTLIYSVFVARHDLKFQGRKFDIGHVQHRTRLFNFVIIYSFATLPGDGTTTLVHSLNPSDRDLESWDERLHAAAKLSRRGWTAEEAIVLHREHRKHFLEEWLTSLTRLPDSNFLPRLFGAASFLGKPTFQSLGGRFALAKLRQAHLEEFGQPEGKPFS